MESIEMDMGLSDIRGSVEVKESPVGKIKDENRTESPRESSVSTNTNHSKRKRREDDPYSLCNIKRPFVVLTKLPDYKIRALRPPTPTQFYSEDECESTSESDGQWEPEADSSGSDTSKSKKKQSMGKGTKSSQKTAGKNNSSTVLAPAPIIVSTAFALCPEETRNSRPDLPEQEVDVEMTVLARKKHMRWQKGSIVEILSKEDGRLKYKVNFEGKGRSLVSGHHMAFDTPPKLDQLYVGARVVVSCPEDNTCFQTGILAELPSRRNRLRFLVFTDDHVPIYVGLPALHLVCRPLENSLDDLLAGPHKLFMERYLRDWPYPHLTQYKIGMNTNAELNGVQQKCEVVTVDCSLIQVVFKEGKQKEWIYRGSTRLEHMVKILKLKDEAREQESDSD